MQTIGEKLLEARQRQGISIREAADATKVRGEFLDAMENNQFERIGLAEVYRRGFLKIYAKFLRLDPDRLVAEYNSLSQIRTTPPTNRRLQREAFSGGEKISPGIIDDPKESEFTSSALETATRPSLERKKLVRYCLLSIGVLLVLVLLFRLVTCGSDPSGDPNAPSQAGSAELPQYTFTVRVDNGSANVKISEEIPGRSLRDAPGKVLFEGLITTNTPKILVARGGLRIDSPDTRLVTVQIGAQRFQTTNPNSTSFLVDPPSPVPPRP